MVVVEIAHLSFWEITMDTFPPSSIIGHDDSFVGATWSPCLLWFHPVISSLSHLLFQDSAPNVQSIPGLGQRLYLVHSWATEHILKFHRHVVCFKWGRNGTLLMVAIDHDAALLWLYVYLPSALGLFYMASCALVCALWLYMVCALWPS